MSVSGSRPARFGEPCDLDALIPVLGFPGRVQAARLAAFQASPAAAFDVNIARDLVVLWDDPRRMVVLDQPSFQPRP